jgi:hypothetical protein
MANQGKYIHPNWNRVKNLCTTGILALLASCSEDPEPPLTSLVTVAQENVGSNCATGGVKIETGIDANRNGTLDLNEVQNSSFVCNGANGLEGVAGPKGDNGAPGLTSLIKVSNEPAGTNCKEGGVKVETGIDNDQNGGLMGAEVTSTVYICNGSLANHGLHTLVLTGNITNAQAQEIIDKDFGPATQQIKIANCTNITRVNLGNLKTATDIQIYANPALEEIDLSGLESIVGNFLVTGSPKLASLNLNKLSVISPEEYFVITETGLKVIDFPLLSIINKGYRMSYSGYTFLLNGLQEISFPLLSECRGEFAVLSNSLGTLSFPELLDADTLLIRGDQVAEISFPKLQHVSRMAIDSELLSSLTFPELLDLDVFYIDQSNLNLSSVNLPKLSYAYAIQAHQTALQSISMPELDSIFFLNIGSNQHLESVVLSAKFKVTTISIHSNSNLEMLTFPAELDFIGVVGNSLSFDQNKLSSSVVNTILSALVASSPVLTNFSSIRLKQSIPAPPTGQGIIDKNSLIANGNTVQTD